MREIKFRAWHDDGEDRVMLPVSNVSWEADKVFVECPIVHPKGNLCTRVIERESHKTVLMQFTGLKDKNGVEIYEGDILAMYKWDYNHKEEIVGYKATVVQSGLGWSIEPCWIGDHHGRFCEVIGNIYENPDLLNSP